MYKVTVSIALCLMQANDGSDIYSCFIIIHEPTYFVVCEFHYNT